MKQCLMVTGGKTESLFLKMILEQEAFDYIIAVDSGADACYKTSIVPDLLIGDLDSISDEAKAYCDLHSVRVMQYPSEKDLGDSEIAILTAIEKGFQKLVILGGTGRRIDHMLTNILMLSKYCGRIECEMLDENNKLKVYHGPQNIQIQVNPDYKYISLVPFSDQVTGVNLSGFKYPLSEATLEQGSSFSISNELKLDAGRIEFSKGTLAVIRSRDE